MEPLVKCTNCGKITDDESLPILVEYEDGKVLRISEAQKQPITSKYYSGGETFRGCDDCLTDKYLMDITEDDL